MANSLTQAQTQLALPHYFLDRKHLPPLKFWGNSILKLNTTQVAFSNQEIQPPILIWSYTLVSSKNPQIP